MANSQEVSAQVKSGDRAGQIFTVKYDMPESVQEAIEMWGEEVALDQLLASVTISLQSFMRTQIKKDNATPETVAEAVQSWAPKKGRGPGKPTSEKIADLFQKLSPEERQAILEEFLSDSDE